MLIHQQQVFHHKLCVIDNASVETSTSCTIMVPEAPKHQKRKSVHAQARQQKKQKLSWSRAAAGSNAAQPATVDATKQPTTTAHKGAPPAGVYSGPQLDHD